MSGMKCASVFVKPIKYDLGPFGTVEYCGDVTNFMRKATYDNRDFVNDDIIFTDRHHHQWLGGEARKRLGLSQTDIYSGEALDRYLTSPAGLRGLLEMVDPQRLTERAMLPGASGEDLGRLEFFTSRRFFDKWCAVERGDQEGQTTERANLAQYGTCGFSNARDLLRKFFNGDEAKLASEMVRPILETVRQIQEPSNAAIEFRAVEPTFLQYATWVDSALDLLFADKNHFQKAVNNYTQRFSEVNGDIEAMKQKAEALIADIQQDNARLQGVLRCFDKTSVSDGVRVWEMSHECYTNMKGVIHVSDFTGAREKVERLMKLAEDLRERYPSYAAQLSEDLELLSTGRRTTPAYKDSFWYQAVNDLSQKVWVKQQLEIHCDEEDSDCEEEYPRLSWDPAKNKVRFESWQLSAQN